MGIAHEVTGMRNDIAARMAIVAGFLGGIAAADSPCVHCPPEVAHECVPTTIRKPIKKVVYDVKCVPICQHRPATFLGCDCCPVCRLKYKKVLVKREITVGEICTTTCLPSELPCPNGCPTVAEPPALTSRDSSGRAAWQSAVPPLPPVVIE
jgi:hypothetical protein